MQQKAVLWGYLFPQDFVSLRETEQAVERDGGGGGGERKRERKRSWLF